VTQSTAIEGAYELEAVNADAFAIAARDPWGVRTAVAALAILTAACGSARQPPLATPMPETPSAAPSPPASTSAPIAVGPAQDAGVLLVQGADDIIYRYDGVTGNMQAVWRHASLTRTMADGAYFEGVEGGITLVRWDGRADRTECGPGKWARLSLSGTCASFADGSDHSLWVRDPSTTLPRLVLPASWGVVDAQWTPDSRSLVLLRSHAGTTLATREHNALWLMTPGGALRKLYEPVSPESFLSGLRVSPDARFALVSEMPIVSASVAADGVELLLIELASGNVTRLGTTLLSHLWTRWSDDGRLAFVRGGGRETWLGKQLVVRGRDGSLDVIAGDPSTVALAPAWHGADLYWVQGAAGANQDRSYVRGLGEGFRYAVRLSAGARTNLPFDGIVEGVRLSADGTSALILARRPTDQPGDQYRQLELWLLHDVAGAARATRLITNLGGLGFGYYGLQPSLFDLVAWSLDPS
jgi:hypothetical protein